MKEVPELDMAELFENEEIMAGYLSEIMVTGDSELIMSAIGDIARAKGMSSINWDAVIKNADNVVLDEDDAPELTEEMMDSARPAHEVLPEIFPADVAEALLKKRGRPKSERPKIQFTARFDADIVEHFRKTGNGWQVRMEEVLRKAIAMGL